MRIVVLKEESFPLEKRIALLPETAQKFKNLGADVAIQEGLGEHLALSNEQFQKAGATLLRDANSLLSSADILLSVHKPSKARIAQLKKGALVISFFDPYKEKELVLEMVQREISSISLELMPRTTLAQKMDALSSQASLAGYVSVIVAAHMIPKIFPMMTTPAGTISPAGVFVIGAGVAGLQAIATARRLGAKVEAFDTRAVVEEQVKSLGAKFIKIDLGATAATKEGYAQALTEEQLMKQRMAMENACKQADIVITTAQTFGKKAPVILTKKNLEAMRQGSLLIDLAIDSGGNIEGAQPNEVVEIAGVKVLGLSNAANQVALPASQMYASNLFHLLSHFWNREKKEFEINPEDEILKSALLTHQKKIINPAIQKLYA